jgi:hypothetical protein
MTILVKAMSSFQEMLLRQNSKVKVKRRISQSSQIAVQDMSDGKAKGSAM